MECLNRQIEHKCITYHNDQWFQFALPENKKYYINISNQACKDVDGVQLVVIDGEPCKPETYKSLGCVSLGTQDDIYFTFDSLKTNYNYLLLVDGYLEDYCKFEIEISDLPKGKHYSENHKKINHKLEKDVVNFAWVVNDFEANQFEDYYVYKRESKAKKSTIIDVINHEKDSYGQNKLVYSTLDTLQKTGLYFYEVYIQKMNQERALVGSFKVDFDKREVEEKFTNYHLILSRTYKKSSALEVVVEDKLTNRIVLSRETAPSRDHQLRYYLKPALDQGITQFKITINNLRNNKREVFEVDWNQYLKK